MMRPIAILGAPSSIGIRPYDDGGMRRLDLAPGVLREQHIAARLAARDLGDVVPPQYRDLVRPPGRPRNEKEVESYSHALAQRIGEAVDAFVIVLGGDCSIVLGCLLGLRRVAGAPLGLVYVDAHSDFATPETSLSGSVASMCLALAVGIGDTPLAHLGGEQALVRADDVVLIGRRDDVGTPWPGQDLLQASPILDIRHAAVRERGPADAARRTLERVTQPDLGGFWIHVDADVIDPSVVPAVDSPEPGGLGLDELADLLKPIVRHPKALGLELTIYDPTLDPDRSSAARLARLLEAAFDGAAAGS